VSSVPADRVPVGVPTVSVQEAEQRMQDGSAAMLVDVREVSEYRELRAAGSLLLPLSQFGVRYMELPDDRTIMLICRSGSRSWRAAAFLLQVGYRDVANVAGGMIAWRAAGLPTRSGPLVPGEGWQPG
jgi:rhodanese-related sulfurtransferase